MEVSSAKRKRLRLTLVLACSGFVVAAIGAACAEFADSYPPHLGAALGILAIIVCPPSLIFVALIDVEPGTADFAVTWLAIAVVNAALYAVIGLGVGRLVWRSGDQGSNSSGGSGF